MTLERGFRRFTIVVSVVVLGLGITIDAMTIRPHTTVRVTLRDGRQFTLLRAGPQKSLDFPEWDRGPVLYVREWNRHADKLSELVALLPEGTWPPAPTPDGGERRDGGRRIDWDAMHHMQAIASVLQVGYWWWADTVWIKAAAGLVALLWIVFFTVRWIARGFTGS